jgi:hypothetical protein
MNGLFYYYFRNDLLSYDTMWGLRDDLGFLQVITIYYTVGVLLKYFLIRGWPGC